MPPPVNPEGANPADGTPARRPRRSPPAPVPPESTPVPAESAPPADAEPADAEKEETIIGAPPESEAVPAVPEPPPPPIPVAIPVAAPTPKPVVVVKAAAAAANGGSSSSKGANQMPQYLHPGVYVEEKPSDVKPIVGVGTSTCGFVGIVPAQITILEPNQNYVPNSTDLPFIPTIFPPQLAAPTSGAAALPAGGGGGGEEETATGAAPAGGTGTTAVAQTIPGLKAALNRANTAVATAADKLKVAIAAVKPDTPATTTAATAAKVAFREAKSVAGRAQDDLQKAQAQQDILDDIAKPGVPVLCTGFVDFKRHFGGFSTTLDAANPGAPLEDPERLLANRPPSHSDLAHGVYAFFNNGGTRCYVMGFRDLTALQDPESLEPFDAVDEIALVAAPGIHDVVVQTNIVNHCQNMGDRFAILDSAPSVPGDILTKENVQPNELKNTDYAALYFPWIKVFDIASKLRVPNGDGEIFVGPSGHMAGLYAHVDSTRGVHKAPANEAIRGALDVRYRISNSIQDGLNPMGINCIRDLNGNIRPWGARTLGGDMNEDFKYINVRRLFLFLRKSIDRGTQWVVFEPNDRALWAKIVRNVSAFLTEVWRDGALFGATPAEAFFVKCDDETNPPDLRELGRVTTEIGVAVVKPAEFVIFQIGQWAGPKG